MQNLRASFAAYWERAATAGTVAAPQARRRSCASR